MKITKAIISAIAAAMLLTGCSAGDKVSVGDLFTQSTAPGSSTESSASGEESRNEIYESVRDVKLSFASEYFLSTQSESFTVACKALVKGAKEFDEAISLKGLGLNKDDLSELITVVISSEPEIWMIDPAYTFASDQDNCIVEVSFKYILTKSEYEKGLEKLRETVDSIIASTAGQSDFEKLRSFHDAVVKRCEYADGARYPYSAYGCLVEGKAVCEGYAKAFGLLCDEVGIGCVPVLGRAKGSSAESHMWNKVRLDNEWYNVDTTWDDPVSDFGKDYVGNDYFGVTDELISADHTEDPSRLLKYPRAEGTKYDYFVARDLYIDDPDDADSVLLVAVTAKADEGSKYVQLRCSDKQTYDEVMQREFTGGDGNARIFDILAEAAKASGGAFSPDSYAITKNEHMLTFTVILNIPQ